ncbi:glycoside hydrolase superfamily [Cladochytrium replicatum]|nr:glycoside hydrolase superfamily [Cladochytrium replicatum]
MLVFLSLIGLISSALAQRSWDDAISLARLAVVELTLEEKAALVSGIGWKQNDCVGSILPNSTKIAGFEGLCLQDGPAGVRWAKGNSAFPSGINIAATFNSSLMNEVGIAIGEEFRGKGVNVWLGPVLNLARTPEGGRNWEGAGGDPYLSSVSVAEQIKGAQSVGVIATAKHYIANEQEHGRLTGSSNVDDRTLREVYLQPFKAAVDAGVGAVMCSYNKLNGTYTCNHPKLMDILKTDLGFNGFVMSDWWATTAGADAANAGLDMMMPGDAACCSGPEKKGVLWGSNLVKLVETGVVPSSRLDDMAIRVLSAWYRLSQDQNFPRVSLKDATVDVQAGHSTLIRQIGVESTVLLKNTKNALPLRKGLKSVALIGQDSSYGDGPNAHFDRAGISGTVAIGWGSGTMDFPYIVTPEEGIKKRAQEWGLSWSQIRVANSNDYDLVAAKSAANSVDAAVVFVYANSGEGYTVVDWNVGDRNDLSLWRNGDKLVNAVASVNPNTIVVIHGPGAVDMPWVNHENITAIVMSMMPGQETGNSIADVLFGAEPSGRLPFTINTNRNQYCCNVDYNEYNNVTYSEGMFIDYMWNDLTGVQPLFWFGHGLSYTTFKYSDITVELVDGSIVATVSVTNTGSAAGVEVVQLYLGYPDGFLEPAKNLRAFEKIRLPSGQSKVVTFKVTDLSIWDVNVQAWAVPAGTFTVYIGASSGDIRETATVDVQGDATKPPSFTPTRSPGGYSATKFVYQLPYLAVGLASWLKIF